MVCYVWRFAESSDLSRELAFSLNSKDSLTPPFPSEIFLREIYSETGIGFYKRRYREGVRESVPAVQPKKESVLIVSVDNASFLELIHEILVDIWRVFSNNFEIFGDCASVDTRAQFASDEVVVVV